MCVFVSRKNRVEVMAGKKAKTDTDKFIDAWEKEECLWNVILNEYKNRNIRQAVVNSESNVSYMPRLYPTLSFPSV